MAYSAHYPFGSHATGPDRYADEFLAALDVAPSDRIGPPRKRPYGKWLSATVALVGAAGLAALHVEDPARWQRWWAVASTAAAPWLERAVAAIPSPKSGSDAPIAPASPLPAQSPALPAMQPASSEMRGGVSTEPQEAAIAEPVETTIAAAPPVAAVDAEIVGGKLAPEKEDPNRARAVAAGLHPEISRNLLARLSDADYRNAGDAIRKALADTPDDDVLYWPLKVKQGVAQFQVHFVPGADEGCRRYVVTIAKDGWATTAPALDNCAVKRTLAKAKGG